MKSLIKIWKLTFCELTFWELTFWEVDVLGVDIPGVDILGIDILRLTPLRHTKPQLRVWMTSVKDWIKLEMTQKLIEVRSADLATQEATSYNQQSVLQVTTSQLAHAPNHILENSGL